MLLWTLGCIYLFKLVVLFSSDIYPGVELLVLFLVFWGTSILFSTVSGCANLHSHQQCTMSPFSSHPHQHLLFLDFWMIVILTGEALICISLVISNVKHLFMCLLTICISSSEKNAYLDPLPIFWLGCLVFWYWVIWGF